MATAGNKSPSQVPAIRLAATLVLGGSMHFIAPKFFDEIIPTKLPGNPRTYTYASGVAAVVIGAGLSAVRTRRFSAALAGAFFVAVMPAKVQLAISWWRSDTKRLPVKAVGIAQLLWQIPLLAEAMKSRRNALPLGKNPLRCTTRTSQQQAHAAKQFLTQRRIVK